MYLSFILRVVTYTVFTTLKSPHQLFTSPEGRSEEQIPLKDINALYYKYCNCTISPDITSFATVRLTLVTNQWTKFRLQMAVIPYLYFQLNCTMEDKIIRSWMIATGFFEQYILHRSEENDNLVSLIYNYMLMEQDC